MVVSNLTKICLQKIDTNLCEPAFGERVALERNGNFKHPKTVVLIRGQKIMFAF